MHQFEHGSKVLWANTMQLRYEASESVMARDFEVREVGEGSYGWYNGDECVQIGFTLDDLAQATASPGVWCDIPAPLKDLACAGRS